MAFGPTLILADIQEMLDQDFMFTAWDITCSLRDSSRTDGVHSGSHSEVGGIIKSMFKAGEMLGVNGVAYEKTNIETPGGRAWLYHPLTATQDEIDAYIKELAWEEDEEDEDESDLDDVDDIDLVFKNIELD